MAESKKRFPGAVGPSYTLRAGKFDCQETMNAYIELDELGSGKGDEPAVLYKIPGNFPLQTIGAGPIRCMYTQSNQEVSYIVSGNELYELSAENAIPIRITGNLLTSTGPVQMSDNGIQIMFVDGQYGYTSVIGSGTFQQITSPHFYPSECITYQDGYFILVQKGTQGFFISDINDITFPPLNEAFVQGSPDILVFAYSNNRQVYMGGAKSMEMWWNQGASASTPFVRQDGKFSQQGCAAANTVAPLNETFLWLGSNSQGGGIVWMLDNNAPKQVSTFPVQTAIQNAGNLNGSTAWSYQQEGHYFYLLNVPGLNYTWVYDLSNGQWTKRSTNINGNQQQLRVQTHCVLNDNHLVGDSTTGDIYRLDLNYYLDGTDEIYFIRQFPHSSDSLNMNFYNLLEIDFQFGVGLPDNPTGGDIVDFFDTYDDPDNTQIIDHSPNVGGSYTMVTGDASTVIISNNYLTSSIPVTSGTSVYTPYASSNPGHDTPVYLTNYQAYAHGVNIGANLSTAAGLSGPFGNPGTRTPTGAILTNDDYSVDLNVGGNQGAAATGGTTQFDSFPVCWEINMGEPTGAIGVYKTLGGPSFNPALYCGSNTINSTFYNTDGFITNINGSQTNTGVTYGPGDIIGVMTGLLGSNVYFFKNGTFVGLGNISPSAAIGLLPFVTKPATV